MKYFIVIFLIFIPIAVFGAKAQCPRYSVSMEGTTVNMGVSYTERLQAHKVGAGSGYNGRWKIELFEQVITYPWDLNFPITTNNVHDLGNGVKMNSTCTAAGNVINCHSTSDNMFLEIVNNQVRMEKTIPWHGKITGNTMSWKFHLENPTEPVLSGVIAEGSGDPVELTIVEPREKGKYVFSPLNGTLELNLEARTKPERHADSVEWTVPEMEGVKRRVFQGSLKGRKLDVVYDNLPRDNSQFGKKRITATLKIGSCTATETRDIQFFYPRDAKNNPEGKYYNWFYYWKQTPAAKPFGQTVNIEFGGTQFDACKDFHVPAMFKPAYMYKTIHICDLTAKLDNKFTIRFPRIKRTDPSTHVAKTYGTTTHIDSFAVLMRHEFIHFNAYHTWREGKTLEQMNTEDADQDGIPDSLEPGMGFEAGTFQTYWGNDPDWKKMGGDEETLAYETMSEYTAGTYDQYDWGKPGKNWE
ncbi:MAG TPA: hypothetical protein PLR60_07720 [Syntrophorhabdaceae bacterium]|nr:hypothetical protein [Syntrophorhabdaceae bacterium]